MKFRGKHVVLVLVTLGLLWLGRSHWLGKARSELVSFGKSVKVGDTVRDARRQCESKSLLKCGSAYEDDVVAATPLEFGATNWVAWIVAREGKVTGVRFRTEDSLDFKPPGSPADRGEAPRADDYRRQRQMKNDER
jgi:hypothetical protein